MKASREFNFTVVHITRSTPYYDLSNVCEWLGIYTFSIAQQYTWTARSTGSHVIYNWTVGTDYQLITTSSQVGKSFSLRSSEGPLLCYCNCPLMSVNLFLRGCVRRRVEGRSQLARGTWNRKLWPFSVERTRICVSPAACTLFIMWLRGRGWIIPFECVNCWAFHKHYPIIEWSVRQLLDD